MSTEVDAGAFGWHWGGILGEKLAGNWKMWGFIGHIGRL